MVLSKGHANQPHIQYEQVARLSLCNAERLVSRLWFALLFIWDEGDAYTIIILMLLMKFLDINDGFLSLMLDDGETKEDLKVPEGDAGKDITDRHAKGEEFMVTVLKACGEEMAIATKNMTK